MRIPPDSEKSNLIRIEGDPQGVQQAKRELLELASRMVRPTVGSCPGGAHGPVSGPLWTSIVLTCSAAEGESPAWEWLCGRGFRLGQTQVSDA